MELFTQTIKMTWDLAVEIFKVVMPMIRTGFSFMLWVLMAIIILPCVYIAGNIYPAWEKWGESF